MIFQILYLLIPLLGAIVTGFLIPLIKARADKEQLSTIIEWTKRAVEGAEVLFNSSKKGAEKREYVIDLIDKKFNAKKEVISKDQIRILLESAWKEMNGV